MRILRGLECSTIFLSQKYYDVLHECYFRITDLMMISFRYCAENAAEIPRKYRGQTAENTAENLWVSYAKRSVYNTIPIRRFSTPSITRVSHWLCWPSPPLTIVWGIIVMSWATTASAVIIVTSSRTIWIPRAWSLSHVGEVYCPHRVDWVTPFKDNPLIIIYRYTLSVEILVPKSLIGDLVSKFLCHQYVGYCLFNVSLGLLCSLAPSGERVQVVHVFFRFGLVFIVVPLVQSVCGIVVFLECLIQFVFMLGGMNMCHRVVHNWIGKCDVCLVYGCRRHSCLLLDRNNHGDSCGSWH